MKELKGTKTEKNLQEAFAGESMARNKYTYFARKTAMYRLPLSLKKQLPTRRNMPRCGISC